MSAARFAIVVLVAIFCTGSAADDFRPLYVEITEVTAFEFLVRTRPPPGTSTQSAPSVRFPESCTREPGARIRCREDPAGGSLTLVYPGSVPPIATVVRISFATGEQHTRTLAPGELATMMPAREDIPGVAAQYILLGVEHIWIGFDHLLFVLCLIWIAGSWPRVLLTITGFTIAHSVTLVLAALDVLRLPVAPIEAVIALSVLFLATELARNGESLTWRYPLAVSSTFGLLHGLGFAAVLGELGLPQLAVLTGLVAFNIGVEIGQLAFAALVMAFLFVARARSTWFANYGQLATAYLVGSVAAYWFIERTIAFSA